MKQLKSLNLKARATPAVAALALLTFSLALTLGGCSKNKSKEVSLHSASTTDTGTKFSTVPDPSFTKPDVTQAVTPRKKTVIRHSSTIGYSDSKYGISFRYPRKDMLLTSDKTKQDSELLGQLPMNFVQPGGMPVAAIEMPGDPGSALFGASVHKGLSSEQCGQFAIPEPSEVSADDSLAPTKTSIRGVEFSYVENTTEQNITRYYHRFDNGVCYEFTLAVKESPEFNKPVDYLDTFDNLERILTTVKIKPEMVSTESASIPSTAVNSGNPK